jgi:hypothetical protein
MDLATIAGKRTLFRQRVSLSAAIAVIGVALVLALTGYINSAGATPSRPEHKVTLCHATSSYTNPYVVITVDVASVLKKGHDSHDGPVFVSDLPKHTSWGDIIPPFDFGGEWVYAGKNWDAELAATFGCGAVDGETTTTSTVPES